MTVLTKNDLITRKTGNIFYSGCYVITNPTNSVGVMGRGLAKDFAVNFPEPCRIFNDYCLSYQGNFKKARLVPPMLIKTVDTIDCTSCAVLMFPTKIHWKKPSQYEYIEQGLIHTRAILAKEGNPTIAFPALGCGLGGLDEEQVFQMIEVAFNDYPATVQLYSAGSK